MQGKWYRKPRCLLSMMWFSSILRVHLYLTPSGTEVLRLVRSCEGVTLLQLDRVLWPSGRLQVWMDWQLLISLLSVMFFPPADKKIQKCLQSIRNLHSVYRYIYIYIHIRYHMSSANGDSLMTQFYICSNLSLISRMIPTITVGWWHLQWIPCHWKMLDWRLDINHCRCVCLGHPGTASRPILFIYSTPSMSNVFNPSFHDAWSSGCKVSFGLLIGFSQQTTQPHMYVWQRQGIRSFCRDRLWCQNDRCAAVCAAMQLLAPHCFPTQELGRPKSVISPRKHKKK